MFGPRWFGLAWFGRHWFGIGGELPPEAPTVADARTLAYRVNAGQIQARVTVVSVR